MRFASTRLVARDIKNLVGFYEKVMNKKAEWLVPTFAEIVTPAATLAINTAETVALFKEGSAEPGANRTAILEFQVDEVDAVGQPSSPVPRSRRQPGEHVYPRDRRSKKTVRRPVSCGRRGT